MVVTKVLWLVAKVLRSVVKVLWPLLGSYGRLLRCNRRYSGVGVGCLGIMIVDKGLWSVAKVLLSVAKVL